MYSWEIDNFLKENDYKITFQQVRDIMLESPQINHWKMDDLISNLDGYGKYHWWTTDNYEWEFYIQNNINGMERKSH